MKRFLLFLIRFYRRAISPYRPPCCRFIPTCSQYALEAIEKYGAVKGGWLAFKRMPLLVVKKDSTREYFDRSKLLSGIIKSCQKRPITLMQMEQIVNEIEAELRNSLSNEISSQHIGVLVMDKLKALDDVAYVRFASVYRDFKDLDTFMHELEELRKQKCSTKAGEGDNT